MENEKEVKSLHESAEELYDKLTSAPDVAQETNSPENIKADEPVQDEANSVKTGTPVAEPVAEKVPDSVPYKRFQEINQKHKEASELLKAKEAEAQRYSKLLDDPDVYAKWLEQQGYSKQHIQQALRDKGFEPKPEKVASQETNQAVAIAERACKKLGWDINRLNDEQKAYINDSVSLTMAIIEESVRPMIDERVGSIESVSQEWIQQKQFNQEELQVKSLAKEEFPDADFEKVIKPAISKYLAELDEKDPKRTIKLTYEDIYYRATRPLLREINESKGRQEVRNVNKQNLRPIGAGPSSKTGEPSSKGRSAREEAEAFLEQRSVR